MKRLKLLPSVLLLILCVGVLCMGIYAASPNSNQITGSITINPAGASVDIRAWAEKADGTQSNPITKTGLRTGGEVINFTDRATFGDFLKLDFGTANDVSDVKPCYIKIEITNNSSTKELGAYISRESMSAQAQKANIFTSLPMTNNSAVTATSLEFYKQMGVANANNNSDTVTLVLEFKANAFIESSDPITFDDYYVNIEEYNPNMTGETLTDTSSGFIKISSTIESAGAQALSTTKTPRTTISSTSGFRNLTTPEDLWVVVPNGVTIIDGGTYSTGGAFNGCTALTKISLPNTITTIENYGLYASNLVMGELPASLTTIYENSFPSTFYTTKTEGYITYKGIPSNPYYWAKSVTDKTQNSYELNNNTKVLGPSLFSGCTSMTSLPTIPSGVTEIPGNCFYKCTGISGELQIPEGIVSIASGAFRDCSNVTSLTLPESLKACDDTFSGTAITQTTDEEIIYLKANENNYYLVTGAEGGALSASGYAINSNAIMIADCALMAPGDIATTYSGITIPGSVIYIGQNNFQDAMPEQLTVLAGDGELAPFELRTSAFHFSEGTYYLTWYLTSDFSGDPVTHITDQPNDVTYYCKSTLV